nr:GTP-binding protein REM 1 isoform X4 [Chrysemys picta bellii]
MFVSSGPASSQEPTEVELKTIPSVPKKMTLNTQQGGKGPVCRRASTPVPLSHQARPGMRELRPNPSESHHPPLGYSSSFEPGDKAPVMPRSSWSSDSADSDSSWESLYRVVLLGDPGVGKTSLVNLFAGIQERDLPEQPGEDAYERTLSVDGEETTLLVMDTWETERRGSGTCSLSRSNGVTTRWKNRSVLSETPVSSAPPLKKQIDCKLALLVLRPLSLLVLATFADQYLCSLRFAPSCVKLASVPSTRNSGPVCHRI